MTNGMPAPKERSSISVPIIKWLNTLPGCYAIKVGSGFIKQGTPDIHATYRGRAIWLESKRTGNETSMSQDNELRKWAEAGAVTAVVHSRDEAKAVMREAFGLDC